MGMSVTVGEISATVELGKCPRQLSWVNVHNSGGNVRNSGEIEYSLENLRVEIVIHNSA